MKVILLRDVAKIGKRFEIADVPDGYAMNKLVPQGMAMPATPENLKKIEAQKGKLAATVAQEEVSFTAVCAALKDAPVTLAIEANEQGHLFKAIKAKEIAETVKEAGHHLLESAIMLEAPIKSIGSHVVTLQHGAVSGILTLEVIAK